MSEYSRREFLRLGGAAFGGVGVVATGLEQIFPTQIPIAEPSETSEVGVLAYSLTGFPDYVDPNLVLKAHVVDAYGNDFRGETLEKVGGNLIFADPGVLLVGPEYPTEQVTAANGAIEYLNEVNHGVVHSPEEYVNLPEGRFLVFSGGQFELNLGKKDEYLYGISVTGSANHNWFVAVRGLHPDRQTPEDRNWTVNVLTQNPGHVEWKDYPPGAFISEDHFLQNVDMAHDGARNCGHEGCPGVSVIAVDANNGSYSIFHQSQKDGEWVPVKSNWFQPENINEIGN